MKSINMRITSTLVIFCSLCLLAIPAAAETPQTIEPEATETEATEAEITEPQTTRPPKTEKPRAEKNTSSTSASISSKNAEQQEAQRIYEQKSLYALHVNLPTLALETDYLNDSWFTPHHGANGYPLTNAEFYKALGRSDLLDQYNANHTKKTAAEILIVTGIAGAGYGIVRTFYTFVSGFSPPYENNDSDFILPLSILAGSAVIGLTGALLYPNPNKFHPLKTNDAAKILDEYNNDLKQELGLPQDYAPSTPESKTPESISLSLEQRLEAQQIYEKKSLYALHVNLPTLALETDYLNDSWFKPHHGTDSHKLTNKEFYETLGSPELLAEYNANHTKNTVAKLVMLTGTAGIVLSSFWIGAYEPTNPPFGADISVPFHILFGSAVVLVTGLVLKPNTIHPLKTNEAAQRLDHYNNALKQELGLPQDYSPTSPP